MTQATTKSSKARAEVSLDRLKDQEKKMRRKRLIPSIFALKEVNFRDQSSRSKRQTSDSLTLSITEDQGLYPARFDRSKSSTTVFQVRLKIKARKLTNGPLFLVIGSHKRRHKSPEDVQLVICEEKTSKRLTLPEDLVKLWILEPWRKARGSSKIVVLDHSAFKKEHRSPSRKTRHIRGLEEWRSA
ncbi:uncharacterized protein PGTG_17756 [Puccinia graminis f. sp. tritici CRL 75-36-700-3]|uniref:Uncharacterized protein n=2 Tax=Puccinia graminis f. sp. tritici TaxID=56615 RepID=E3L4N1_PUCGT|nr:uncharacterized protein PGTG_17756 [Puccinia graminis f. sp. tritici CRL 75-36-700-3]EFP91506.1 hypothetical protein PGTG_17756 [Puccinia graminis f. sp. tritici CRL 75-36-700-3]